MPTKKSKAESLTVKLTQPSLRTEELAIVDGPAVVIPAGNAIEHERACLHLKELKAGRKRVVEEFGAIKKPISEGLDRVRTMERALLDRIDVRLAQLSDAILAWRKAEADRRDAEAAAAKKAEEERLRAEREAQAAAARAVAEVTEHPEAQESLLTWAEQIEQSPLPPVKTTPAAPIQTAGSSEVTRWRARVTDKMALIKAVAEGKASPDLLDANQSALNALARQLKSFLAIPGVIAEDKDSLVTR